MIPFHRCKVFTHKTTADHEFYCGKNRKTKKGGWLASSYAWIKVTCPDCLKYQDGVKRREYQRKQKEKRAAAAQELYDALRVVPDNPGESSASPA